MLKPNYLMYVLLGFLLLLNCYPAKCEETGKTKLDAYTAEKTEKSVGVAVKGNETPVIGQAKDESEKVTKIAEMVLKSTEEKFKVSQDLWDTATKILSVLIGLGILIISGAAFLGYKNIKDINSKIPKLEILRDQILESQRKHEEDARKIGHALRSSVSALRELTVAYRLSSEALDLVTGLESSDQSEPSKKKRHAAIRKIMRAERLVRTALTEENEIVARGDSSVVGWAYQILGFAVGELNRLSGRNTKGEFEKALGYLEKGLDSSSEQSSGWYNAACYAAILDKREKAVHHLKEAIRIDSDCGNAAATDPDFKTCYQDEDFRVLTRLDDVHQTTS